MAEEREPIGWYTYNGRHIPIFEDSGDSNKERNIDYNKKEAEKRNSEQKSHFQKHKDAIEKLSDSKYEDGTYNVDTLQSVEFDSGYQFTFCQIGDDYSEEEYNALVNGILSKLENKNVFAGKFEATPEISFYTKDKEFAMEIGRRYNQISIWDWGNCDEIKTGGTGRKK